MYPSHDAPRAPTVPRSATLTLTVVSRLMATNISPNSNPFAGGSFTPGTVPNLNGSIQPASTGSSLIGGVQGSTPMIARNNRGSNVTVPYARVVMHPPGNTALGPLSDALAHQDDTRTIRDSGLKYDEDSPKGKYVETELLFSGKVAFVLGRRGKNYEVNPPGQPTTLDYGDKRDGQARTVPFRAANAIAKFAVGGADVNTLQRMCSYDYLVRYFHHYLRKRTIELGTDDELKISKSLGGTGGMTYPSALRKQDGDLAAGSALKVDADEILKALSEKAYAGVDSGAYAELVASSTGGNLATELANSGIFVYDDGPFLRGKTLEKGVVDIAGMKKVPLAIGDRLAFQKLEQLLGEVGALDWQPDGLVHSKLSQGDTQLDDELDSRDGMLFNITVQGPTIATTWCDDSKKAVMPLDKMFVLVVGDVWYGVDKAAADAKWSTNDAAYKTAKGGEKKDGGYKNGRTENPDKCTITNLRPRLSTSSEMVSYSAPSAGRMGLKQYPTVGEYVVGGWCIGTVLDSAAARASGDHGALMGAVKKQRINHGVNVAVNVEWWSADRLYRSYMNVNGAIRTRYNEKSLKPEVYVGDYAPASKREKTAPSTTTTTTTTGA
mgnify:CR=1 FL=1